MHLLLFKCGCCLCGFEWLGVNITLGVAVSDRSSGYLQYKLNCVSQERKTSMQTEISLDIYCPLGSFCQMSLNLLNRLCVSLLSLIKTKLVCYRLSLSNSWLHNSCSSIKHTSLTTINVTSTTATICKFTALEFEIKKKKNV